MPEDRAGDYVRDNQERFDAELLALKELVEAGSWKARQAAGHP